jgi:hypothetical protein
MTSAALTELVQCVDDPHAFATAYVAHVERTGNRPDVTTAVQRWIASGQVD